MGFDARELTPTVVLRIAVLAAETRSFKRAEKSVSEGAGLEVSAKTIERVVHAACFRDPKHVAKIAETEALSVAAALPSTLKPVAEDEQADVPAEDWRP
ncbi:MAG: hypothetical protein NTW96_04345, partial [Planctomycetia bacterium]|nr:hypothetical protein [Planctomycetia bacterium]